MKKTKLIMLVLVLILALALTGCQDKTEEFTEDSGKLNVYVSFYPMEFLLAQIGQDHIDLKTIVPQGMEPHDFEPSLRDMKNLDKTDVFVYNGLGLETWADDLIAAAGKDDMLVINASESVKTLEGHEGKDPHIWLNPINMIDIGETIVEGLIERDPKNEKSYRENYEGLKIELEELDREYDDRLKDKEHKDILVSHEAFSYMADRYGFNQISVAGISPEEEPSPKNIASLIDISKEKGIKYIFLETLSNSKAVDIISKEAGLEVLILNPLEGLTDEDIKNDRDYMSIMYGNLDQLEKALID